MRDDHTREQEGARVKSGGKGMITAEGRRAAIEKRTGQIKKWMVQQPEKNVNDGSGGQWSGQRRTEQGKMQQPTIYGSGKGKQWLAITRVRGQRLATEAKEGSSRRRNCHGQRG
jgi:hypothetical protein